MTRSSAGKKAQASLFSSTIQAVGDSIARGDMSQAAELLKSAIPDAETTETYHLYKGVIAFHGSQFLEAAENFTHCLLINPRNIDALNNLGSALVRLGRFVEAVPCLEKAYALAPNFSICQNISVALLNLHRYHDAIPFLIEAMMAQPMDRELRLYLANAYHVTGQEKAASESYHQMAMDFPNDALVLGAFVNRMHNKEYFEPGSQGHTALIHCLQHPEVNHQLLSRLACSFIKKHSAYQDFLELGARPPDHRVSGESLAVHTAPLADTLINLVLRRMIVTDADLEQAFTRFRRSMLLDMDRMLDWPGDIFTVLLSMATQGWLNEYVWLELPDETEQVNKLQESLKHALTQKKNTRRERLALAILGAYRSLGSLGLTAHDVTHIKKQWPDFHDLLARQIDEPAIEADLKKTIENFVPITDDVSNKVQAQYESKPYPRWNSSHQYNVPDALAELTAGMEILNAGCGTGQEAIHMAKSFPFAKVTAIDLSYASLAYAKRKAIEMGVADRITFLQGDLMEVKRLGKQFDLIASSGVLHHMQDPLKGFGALKGVMKEKVRFFLCLYSKIARDYTLNPAQSIIKEKGYTATDADIRAFRQAVLALPQGDDRRRCAQYRDFYSLSECCDLMFHVQEHRYTLLDLKDIFDRFDFSVMGLPHPEWIIKQYMSFAGPDPDMTDLDRWHAFEEAHPESFISMHRFWLKGKGDIDPHPADAIIRDGYA